MDTYATQKVAKILTKIYKIKLENNYVYAREYFSYILCTHKFLLFYISIYLFKV